MDSLLSQLSIALDIGLFLLTAYITIMSFRLYRLFRKPRYLQFSTGFLFISIGYFFIALISILTYPHIHTLGWEQLEFGAILARIWFVSVLIGLSILVFLYYGVEDRKMQFLLLFLLAAGFALGGGTATAFFVLSSCLFFFIAFQLYYYYLTTGELNTLYVLAGFSSLFFAKLMSEAILFHPGFFIGFYLFKLAGVVLIAFSFWAASR